MSWFQEFYRLFRQSLLVKCCESIVVEESIDPCQFCQSCSLLFGFILGLCVVIKSEIVVNLCPVPLVVLVAKYPHLRLAFDQGPQPLNVSTYNYFPCGQSQELVDIFALFCWTKVHHYFTLSFNFFCILSPKLTKASLRTDVGHQNPFTSVQRVVQKG